VSSGFLDPVTPGLIALCVPCFRESERVPELATGLRALDPAPGVILLLDDGSGDHTGPLLRDEGFEVLVHERNLGLGVARNTLWRRAEALGMTAVAFIDADVVPPTDYLRRVAGLLSESGLAGVGGRNVDSQPRSRSDVWRGRFWPQSLGDYPLMDAPLLVGACASYRIAALREVGGFNPDFRTHGEDVEVGRRLRLTGQRLGYEPSLMVHHRRCDEPQDLLRSCFLHCREGMRATLATPIGVGEPVSLVLGMGRKLVRAPLAALVKRRDPAEAALGVAACSAGLLGYAVGWGRP
jgi:GT2 family glycosyltransferase